MCILLKETLSRKKKYYWKTYKSTQAQEKQNLKQEMSQW